MSSQSLYLEDPLTFEFNAAITGKVNLPGGKTGAFLDRTYFYPTGGGQEYDTGTIGEAQVVDVYKEGNEVVHVLDRDIEIGAIRAAINKDRRIRHMQQHTAQHLLTECFLQLFNLDTLSCNINGYSPTTLDLPATTLSKEDLERVEALANQIVFESRAVKSYFVTPEEVKNLPLRRQPTVNENIRIVEIDSFDYTPCGGTHCTNSGMIGVIKIVKVERPNKERTRISFVSGWPALQLLGEYHEIASNLSRQLGVPYAEIVSSVERQTEKLKAGEDELKLLRAEHLANEARHLAETAGSIGSPRFVLASFDQRPMSELRALADELKNKSGLIAALASYSAPKVSLIVTSARDTGISARQLLDEALAFIGGRGGGDAIIAQGGGSADEGQYQALLEKVKDYFNNR